MSRPYDKPDWASPPSPEEGEIASVEFHTKNTLAFDHHVQPCQNCDSPVRINQDHVLAMIEFDQNGGTGFDRARFCGRECWIEWAKQ